MHVDVQDSLGITLRPHEPFQLSLMLDLIAAGDLVADVGAHLGYFSFFFQFEVESEGKVVAFEPFPALFDLLKLNTREDWVIRENCAVGEFQGIVLLREAEFWGDNRVAIHNKLDHRPFQKVRQTSLDEYFKDSFWGELKLAKVDVQGYDGNVISGARDLMEKERIRNWMFEFWPSEMGKNGKNPEDILNMLRGYGFELKEVKEWERDVIQIMDIGKFCSGFKIREESELVRGTLRYPEDVTTIWAQRLG